MEILFEDNHIIVVYKPKGILSQGDGTPRENMLDMLKEYIKEKYQKPGNVYLGLVHRLDINTSGIMVFAKTSKAAKRLSEAIALKQFVKKYIATVEGVIENKDFVRLEHRLLKNESLKKSFVDAEGQISVLYYKLRKSYTISNVDVSDVEILLETGRYHQIRAQMAAIGHVLYGDKKYGSIHLIDPLDFPLQAYSLSFPHPISKEILEFEKIV